MLNTLPIAILTSIVYKGLGAEEDLPLDSFLSVKFEDSPIDVKKLLDEYYNDLPDWALLAIVKDLMP